MSCGDKFSKIGLLALGKELDVLSALQPAEPFPMDGVPQVFVVFPSGMFRLIHSSGLASRESGHYRTSSVRDEEFYVDSKDPERH